MYIVHSVQCAFKFLTIRTGENMEKETKKTLEKVVNQKHRMEAKLIHAQCARLHWERGDASAPIVYGETLEYWEAEEQFLYGYINALGLVSGWMDGYENPSYFETQVK